MCSPEVENCTLPHCQCGCASQQIQVANVRFGSKADIAAPPTNVRFTPKSVYPQKRTLELSLVMSALCQNLPTYRNTKSARGEKDGLAPSLHQTASRRFATCANLSVADGRQETTGAGNGHGSPH